MGRLPAVIRTYHFLVLMLVALDGAAANGAERDIPKPLPDHPGNVFLEPEEVILPIPARTAKWKLLDVDEKAVGEGDVAEGQDISLGNLGVGWYRADFVDPAGEPTGWTTAAVLTGLKAPVPDDSPVCTDSATAWFARRYEDQPAHQEILANLAALAGVNWIRDRLAWGEVERSRGKFTDESIYDSSATLAADEGLRVLQVFHSTPGWAADKTLDGERAWSRFPRDLRDQYAFCKAMARRFQGRVQAWEPWNEANIEPFGGHTIDEMCFLQKAAYLGFKAGDPDLKVCWNVYAGSGSPLHTEGVIANEAWPYFETYNIHSYSEPEQYESQFATARQGACGRPIWITECGIRLTTDDKHPWGDLTSEDERKQARFLAQSYASSLFAGAERHFFFILGNYIERGVQFGLLRHDHTPRPGYVALAAVGRLLAGAECLGRVSPTIIAFRAQPDGRDQEVLVAWGKDSPWPLPADLQIDALFDYLGRPMGKQAPSTLGPGALFILLPPGDCRKLTLEPPPDKAPRREGEPSPVVLQLALPARTAKLRSQSHEIEPGADSDLPLLVYNFAERPVSGTLAVENAPADWDVGISKEPIRVEPMGRQEVKAKVRMPATGGLNLVSGEWLKLRGDFGPMGRPVLAFRLSADLVKLEPAQTQSIPSAEEAANWQDNIVQKATMSRQPRQPSGTLFEMQFADTDPWAYPRLPLKKAEVPANRYDGLALSIEVLEGTGTVRVQFIEESGASYLAETGIDDDGRELQRTVVLFRDCTWSPFSKPDPDGKLQPADIRTILVGINSKPDSRVKMAVTDLEWVRF